MIGPPHHAGVAELADALDLGSSPREGVRVRVPPPAFFCLSGRRLNCPPGDAVPDLDHDLATDQPQLGGPRFQASRHPYPGIAGFVTLLFPLCGYAYAGFLRRGIMAWLIVDCVILLLQWLAFTYLAGLWFVGAIALATLLHLARVLDVILLSRRTRRHTQRHRYQHVGIYLLLAFVNATVNVAISFAPAITLESYSVTGKSMAPALLPGDRVVFDIRPLNAAALQRGEIVVYKRIATEPVVYAARIVGLPGEEVAIYGHHVAIDGQLLEEVYRQSTTRLNWHDGITSSKPVEVPEGSYFLLGDNRGDSVDSRTFGPIPFEQLVGTARVVIWSTRPSEADQASLAVQADETPSRWRRIGLRLD